MELFIAFLTGVILATVVAVLIARSQIASREASHKMAMETIRSGVNETVEKIKAQIKAETEDMLKARQQEFSETSSKSIGQIVTPLNEKLAELRKAMEEENKEQAMRSGEMKEGIRNLMNQSDATRKSAEELAKALKFGTKVQGDWGETVLEELLTAQGLTKGIHFDVQTTLRDSEGRVLLSEGGSRMRPDVILHLDNRREVIVDSKVSLNAFIDYVNADNEEDRKKCLDAHIASLKKHIKELSVKEYSEYVKSPKVSAGYVIMFVPNTGALWAALNAEPALWRTAADMNVYIADEQSLYAAVKMVKMTWTMIAQAQNHEKVYELAHEMVDRVGQFMKKYNEVGKALEGASKVYEDGKKKLLPGGQSILTTAGKLIKMGTKDSSVNPVEPFLDVDDIQAVE